MCPTDLRKEKKKLMGEVKKGREKGEERVYKTNTGPHWNHWTERISLGEFKDSPTVKFYFIGIILLVSFFTLYDWEDNIFNPTKNEISKTYRLCYGYAYQRKPEVAVLISDKIGF